MYDGGCLFSPPRGDAREHVSIIRGDRRRENAPEHLDDARDLVVLARAGEEREPEEELDGDAPERPHVDCGGVRQAEQHLRRAVEARLDIRVHRLPLVARRAKVDHLDLRRLQPANNRVRSADDWGVTTIEHAMSTKRTI